MSNLNSAFIKVYKKSESGRNNPAPATTTRPDLVQETIAYRFDSGAQGATDLKSWLTTISTVDVQTLEASQSRDATPIASHQQKATTTTAVTSGLNGIRIDQAHTRHDIPAPAPTTQTPTVFAYPQAPIAQAPIAQAPIAQAPIPTPQPVARVTRFEPANAEIDSQESASPIHQADEIPSSSPTIHRFDDVLPFHAVWEVDRFQWPAIIEDLFRNDHALAAEIGRQLRQTNRRGLKVLAVTSPVARLGRTTVACCLAKSAARMGLSVALVDGDLHHPDLADQLNLEVASDWQNVTSSGIPLEEAAIHSIEDRITLLPLKSRKPSLPLAPDHPKVQQVLNRLAESFDLVIIDSQHLDHPSGRLMGCGVVSPIDAAILVVDAGFPNDQTISDSLRSLSRIGIDSVGIVENFR